MHPSKSAHVIVLGNEKGGSGKTTTAMHLIVSLLKRGYSVASIDTDSRQRSLTRYIENRARWSAEKQLGLALPTHHVVDLGTGESLRDIELQEFTAYAEIIDRVDSEYDFVVVDTPASDSYLMRLSHAMADTIITPINDSFIDLDVLGHVAMDGVTVTGVSHYAELVQSAREEKLRAVEGEGTDWVVVRNRLATLSSRNQINMVTALKSLQDRLGFRIADGISERVIFRELFAIGLTAFDPIDKRTHGVEPSVSHVAARREIDDLVACLDLPGRAAPPLAPASPEPVDHAPLLAAE